MLTCCWTWYDAYMNGGGGGGSFCWCCQVNGLLPPGGPPVGIISGPGPCRQSGTESGDIEM